MPAQPMSPWRIGLVLSLIAVVGCAAMVESRPTVLAPAAAADARTLVVREAADIALPTRYTRRLEAGSRWRLVGRLAEGEVWRPVDAVFTIEGRHVHEAHLVVAGRSLQGFYLAGESRYAPLPTPVPLSLGESSP